MKPLKYIVIFIFVYFGKYTISAQDLHLNLQGSSQDTTIQYVKIGHFSPFWQHNAPATVLAESIKQADNSFKLLLRIDKPSPISFIILGETVHIYAFPGDSINFTITREEGRPKINFSGKNAAYYNYQIKMDKAVEPRHFPVFSGTKDIHKYKAVVDDWYKRKIAFLKQYDKQHNLSKEFIRYAENEIQSEYVYLLYQPLGNDDVSREALPKGYFDQADTFNIHDPNLLYFSTIRMWALTYKYVLYYTDKPWENFDTIYLNIKQNFHGRTRAYLISNLIGVYAKRQLQNYKSSLVEAIQEAPHYVKDTICLNYIAQCEQEYLMLNRPFPQEVLANTYLRSFNDGSRMSLVELLEKYKNQAVYIDFWASWCGPCKEDIANSTEAKQYLKDNNIKYVYISLDREVSSDKWKKDAVGLGITHDQYILSDDFSSPLAEFLKIRFIPQYLIIDKNHIVKNINAPRPTTSQLSELQLSIADALGQFKRYD